MAAAAPPAAATNQTLIVETQKSLIRMGYDPGTLGQAGPELTSAVFKYQRNKGLLETGELSQALLTHMLRNGD
jgi:peptidoglycan hydrolase-like protein with peptidoglycan-binding domain